MGATVGPNIGLSNFIGDKVVKVLAENEDIGNTCKNLEELLHSIEKYNEKRIENGDNRKKMVIGSMDIIKWYPNIIAEPAAKIIGEMMIDSEIEFEEIDDKEVGKYLAKFMTEEDKIRANFEDILPG